jgi:hypothetical protein
LALILGFAGTGRAEALFVPPREKANLILPYRVTVVNRYEKSPELPPLFAAMLEEELAALLKLGLGKMVSLGKDADTSRRLKNLLDAKGIERVTAQDIPDTCPFDRIILGDIRKVGNLFEVRLLDVAPQDARISPVVLISTLHPRRIGRLYAVTAVDNFSLEGYITDLADSRPAVTLRAGALMPPDFVSPDTRMIFQIVEVVSDIEGKVLKRNLLPWWYVEIQGGVCKLVGQDFAVHPNTEEYTVAYKVFRVRLQGGKQAVRLVSQKDPDQSLPHYSVLASYTPVMDKYRNLVGLSNERGEVELEDKDRLPLYLQVEKDGLTVAQRMLLVQPGADPLVIQLPEVHPQLPKLLKKAKVLADQINQLDCTFNGMLGKVGELVTHPEKRDTWLTEAKKARADLIGMEKQIGALEKEAAADGADISQILGDMKSDLARRTASLHDPEKVLAEAVQAGSGVAVAEEAGQSEKDAAQLFSDLKWKEAVAKYEEALQKAPEDQKARIEQKLAAAKPKDKDHEAARNFVRDDLPKLDPLAACNRIAEIQKHVQRLVDAQDAPFLTAAAKTLPDLNDRIVAAGSQLQKEAEKNPKSLEQSIPIIQKMVDASKSLERLIARLQEGVGKP